MEVKTPLLRNGGGENKEIRRKSSRSNSVTSLRSDFCNKLPDKVRSGLDPELPFHLDLSKTTGLIEGKF